MSARPWVTLLLLALVSQVASAQGITTSEIISRGQGGVPGDRYSWTPSISSDGMTIAFASDATNLVLGDNNGRRDVFVYDRTTNSVELVSKATDGTIGNRNSVNPQVTADGRYVTFASDATNLVLDDSNGVADIFVFDRVTKQTVRASVDSTGVQANRNSHSPKISNDGRHICFLSVASNLVPGDTNDRADAFVRDRISGTTIRVSLSSEGTEGNGHCYSVDISGDGQCIAFGSDATNLVPNDLEQKDDVFLYDRGSASTEMISQNALGEHGSSHSWTPSLSDDGRYVAFVSWADNLVAGDLNELGDVFIKDRQTGELEIVSVSTSGTQADRYCREPSVSGNGRFVVFESDSNSLARDLSFQVMDVFLRDRLNGTTLKVSLGNNGYHPVSGSESADVDDSGSYVVFTGSAPSYSEDLSFGNVTQQIVLRTLNAPLPYRQLNISSFNPTSQVTVNATADRNGRSAGVTPFNRIYEPNTPVTLSAPEFAGPDNTKVFDHFLVDGVKSAGAPVVMDQNHTVTAVYVGLYRVSINSSSASTVVVRLSSPDYNGAGNALTPFVRRFKVSVPFSVTAPATASGKAFLRWQRNGANLQDGKRTVTIVLSADTTMTAVYAP